MKKVNIVTIGISGFPYLKVAPVNKCLYINKVFAEAGFGTLVLNKEPLLTGSSNPDYLPDGEYDGVHYHSLTDFFRPESKIKRRLIKFFGEFSELLFLIKYNNRVKIDGILFFTNGSFLKLIWYRVVSKLLGSKLILVYHEYRSDFAYRRKQRITRLNDKMFDKYFINFVDAVFPISEFLIEHIKKINKHKPTLKIPPLTNFSLYEKTVATSEAYFLFCGSAGFQEIIEFIVDAFELLETTYMLYLVCSGNKQEISVLRSKINNSSKKDQIRLFSDISEPDLIQLYNNSKALLIPLKDDLRDQARFPQKTSEYTASGSPLVSTKFGEIDFYFTDGVNALVADKYDVSLYAEKMKFVIDNPEQAKIIGNSGRAVGRLHFDYLSYTGKMKEFVNKLLDKTS